METFYNHDTRGINHSLSLQSIRSTSTLTPIKESIANKRQ